MKTGDKVIMNDRYKVSDKNKGRVFIVKSEPWDLCGTDCVLLEGDSSGYAADGLTVVNGAIISWRNGNQWHFLVRAQPLNPDIPIT